MPAVEFDHLVTSPTARHDRDVVDVIDRGHRGDGRFGILGGELESGVRLPQSDHFGFTQAHRLSPGSVASRGLLLGHHLGQETGNYWTGIKICGHRPAGLGMQPEILFATGTFHYLKCNTV